MEAVPSEVWKIIFSSLDPLSFLFAERVCKLWRHILQNDPRWKSFHPGPSVNLKLTRPLLKFIVVGNEHVGKSTFIDALARGIPTTKNSERNLGGFSYKNIERDGMSWRVDLWDIYGQARTR